MAGTLKDLIGGRKPVVGESCLQLCDHRSVDTEMEFAPFIRIAGITRPVVRNADAADEADPAVNDEQLAVGAKVVAAKIPPEDRMVDLQVDSGSLHFIVVDLGFFASVGVEDDIDFDAGPRSFGQCLRELCRHVTAFENVGLEVDSLPGAADGVEHRGKYLVAVAQRSKLVSGDEALPEQRS